MSKAKERQAHQHDDECTYFAVHHDRSTTFTDEWLAWLRSDILSHSAMRAPMDVREQATERTLKRVETRIANGTWLGGPNATGKAEYDPEQCDDQARGRLYGWAVKDAVSTEWSLAAPADHAIDPDLRPGPVGTRDGHNPGTFVVYEYIVRTMLERVNVGSHHKWPVWEVLQVIAMQENGNMTDAQAAELLDPPISRQTYHRLAVEAIKVADDASSYVWERWGGEHAYGSPEEVFRLWKRGGFSKGMRATGMAKPDRELPTTPAREESVAELKRRVMQLALLDGIARRAFKEAEERTTTKS